MEGEDMFIRLFIILLCGSNLTYANPISLNKLHPFTFTYQVENLSLSPVFRNRPITVLIQKNLITAVNLATGENINEKNIPYLKILLDAIRKKSNAYLVKYDSNDFPQSITSKKPVTLLGSSFSINILEYSNVDRQYKLDAKKLRVKYFKQNYQKWKAFNNDSYYFSYQNKQFDNIYIDGLEVSVKNNKVFSLKDIFSTKDITLSSKNKVMTINQMFHLIENNLKEVGRNKMTVFYNSGYGYPCYIMKSTYNRKEIEIFIHRVTIIK